MGADLNTSIAHLLDLSPAHAPDRLGIRTPQRRETPNDRLVPVDQSGRDEHRGWDASLEEKGCCFSLVVPVAVTERPGDYRPVVPRGGDEIWDRAVGHEGAVLVEPS